jgi:multidrug efflux pump subunit AcrB
LRATGLTSGEVSEQLQFFLSGVTVSQVREDIRTVDVVARSAGQARLDPARVGDFTLSGANGERVSLSQIGKLEVQMEEPVLLRRDRVPTVTVRGNIADPSDAVVEATVQRSRPVILTALAAVLAFVPLTHSVFWERWRSL